MVIINTVFDYNLYQTDCQLYFHWVKFTYQKLSSFLFQYVKLQYSYLISTGKHTEFLVRARQSYLDSATH